MNVEVLPLKVLVTRQVVRNRVDYSTFLNGTLKEELDRLDMLAGDFRIEDSRVIIDGVKGLSSEDWQERKKYMPRSVVNPVESNEDFSIVEKTINGKRTWTINDLSDTETDLMSNMSSCEERSGFWIYSEDFIEDGRLVSFAKVSEVYNSKMRLSLHYYQSLIADKQGNLTRRLIFDVPILGIKITKDIWAVRIKEAQNSSELEDGKDSEEGDVEVNATLASQRQAVKNGLLSNAGGLGGVYNWARRSLRTREERDIQISESESLVCLIVTFVVVFFCGFCVGICA